MKTSDHIKQIKNLIKLSSMTNEEKEIITNALHDYVLHQIKQQQEART